MKDNKKAPPPTKQKGADSNALPLNNNIVFFPVQRRHGLSTIKEIVREYKSVRVSRGNYSTPMPEDYLEVRHVER